MLSLISAEHLKILELSGSLIPEVYSEPCQASKIKRFFIGDTFIVSAGLRFAGGQANAGQHPEAELLAFENYSHSLSTLSAKDNRTYSKK